MAHYDDIALRDAKGGGRLLPDIDPVSSRWSPPLGLPGRGRVTSAPIPAPASGFTPRFGKIYLPPAYFADPRPRLPVLVLLAGQPGTPQDWLSAGEIARIMDPLRRRSPRSWPRWWWSPTTPEAGSAIPCAWTRGAAMRTPTSPGMCLPGYERISPWTRTRRAGRSAGVSYGGTCALQLATNHPDVYPTFLDHRRFRRAHARRPGPYGRRGFRNGSRRVCPGEPTRSSSGSPVPGQRRSDRGRYRRCRYQTRCPPGVPGDDGGRNGQPLHRSAGFARLARLFRRPGSRAAVAGAANRPHRRSGVVRVPLATERIWSLPVGRAVSKCNLGRGLIGGWVVQEQFPRLRGVR